MVRRIGVEFRQQPRRGPPRGEQFDDRLVVHGVAVLEPVRGVDASVVEQLLALRLGEQQHRGFSLSVGGWVDTDRAVLHGTPVSSGSGMRDGESVWPRRSRRAPVVVGQTHRIGDADEHGVNEVFRLTAVFGRRIDGDGGDGRRRFAIDETWKEREVFVCAVGERLEGAFMRCGDIGGGHGILRRQGAQAMPGDRSLPDPRFARPAPASPLSLRAGKSVRMQTPARCPGGIG